MKVTYLYHSGFAVELERHVLVFDHWKGELPKWSGDKTILFFASHKHQDHFTFQIFDRFQEYDKLYYVLSSDIKLSERYLEKNGVPKAVKEAIVTAGKHRTLRLSEVQIETLRSTDAGVAFLVTAEGKSLYHAGDLNWWRWEGESGEWNRQMELDYKREMALLDGRDFDAAFVPLDPRLGAAYDLGLCEFLKHARARHIFPMHMWDDYSVVKRFRESGNGRPYADLLMEIAYPGQEFII